MATPPITPSILYQNLTGADAFNQLSITPMRCAGAGATYPSSPAHKLQLFWDPSGPIYKLRATPLPTDADIGALTVRGAYLKMELVPQDRMGLQIMNVTRVLTLDDEDPAAAGRPITPDTPVPIPLTQPQQDTYMMMTGQLNGCSFCWRRAGTKLMVAHLQPDRANGVEGPTLANALLDKGYINSVRMDGVFGRQALDDPRFPGYGRDPNCHIFGIWRPTDWIDGRPVGRWHLYGVWYDNSVKTQNMGAIHLTAPDPRATIITIT